jgi:hypothetical protein
MDMSTSATCWSMCSRTSQTASRSAGVATSNSACAYGKPN